MFEFLTTNPAVPLLKEDHDRVKELFDRFEAAKTRAVPLLKEDHDRGKEVFDGFEAAKARPAKIKIVRAALVELKVHAAIEEEMYYPAVRKPVGKEIMDEADEEHHVAKLLIAE